ncbi:hypothetical protein MMC11_008205 [Xylographa trunciseda]|nr:hypothetical protein [Xylographa trunciseda]
MDDDPHYRAIRQAQDNNLVVGCGTTPPSLAFLFARREIDRFIQDIDTCNLFLLALAELQLLKDDRMFEQSIYLKVREIAKRYKTEELKAKYIAAAKRFRLPYWDPLLVRYIPDTRSNKPMHCGIPKILCAGQVCVRTPEDPNSLANIDNPLYCYKFAPKYKYNDELPFEWKKFWSDRSSWTLKTTPNKSTLRGPNFNGLANNRRVNENITKGDPRQPEFLNFLLQSGARMQKMFILPSPAGMLPADVYGIFATNSYYINARNSFNPKPGLPGSRAYGENSVEAFHGAIHGIIGRGEPPTAEGRMSLIGHMSNVPYSSFDPIFWLHHCNIDRLIALWQHMNSAAWDFSSFGLEANFVEPCGIQETPATPLFPFRRSPDSFWDSNACRNPESLGYNYEDDYLMSPTDTKEEIKGKITSFYGWLFPGGNKVHPKRHRTGYPRDLTRAECLPRRVFIDHKEPAPDHDFPREVSAPLLSRGINHVEPDPINAVPLASETSASKALAPIAMNELNRAFVVPAVVPSTATGPMTQTSEAVPKDNVPKDKREPIQYRLPARPTVPRNIRKPSLVTSDPAKSHVVKAGKLRHWEAFVRYEKFALSGSFDVLFFIGDFATNAGKWFSDRNLVGSAFNFANSNAESCPNCRVQASRSLLLVDAIHLTHALLNYVTSGQLVNSLRLESLEPEAVVPFLTRNLHWRILDGFGQERQREEIAGLKVLVRERQVSLPLLEGDAVEYEDYSAWIDITHGRPGGLNRDEEF